MMNKLSSVASTALSVLVLTFAMPVSQSHAQESASPISANLSLTSDYRFRGISQNNSRPAVQGGLDYEHASGAYVGTWASNVSWLADGGGGSVSNSLEMDFYGGYRGEFQGVGYDAGLLYYWYPGSYPTGTNSPDTAEFYVSGSFQVFTLKYSHALTDLFGFPDSDGAGYLDLSAELPVAGWTIGLHAGHQRIPSGAGRSSSDCSYTDWSVSGGRSFFGLDFSLAYIDTNAKGGVGGCYRNAFNRDLGDATLVLAVGKSF